MTRARRSSVALLLTALLVVVPVGTATAHDQLIGTDPEDGSAVEAPDDIRLTFSGAIGDLGAQVAVTDAAGRSVVEGDPQVDGAVVEQDLVDDLAGGDYAVVWRVTSEDGHPISGELGFTVVEDEDEDEDDSDEATEASTPDDATGSDDDATESATSAAADATATGSTDDADVTAGPDEAVGAGGLPVWAWALVALGAVGVLGLLARTWSRGRE